MTVTICLILLFFWLYRKKKYSGKKATILFFIVKGTFSTILILFGMIHMFYSEKPVGETSITNTSKETHYPIVEKMKHVLKNLKKNF